MKNLIYQITRTNSGVIAGITILGVGCLIWPPDNAAVVTIISMCVTALGTIARSGNNAKT